MLNKRRQIPEKHLLNDFVCMKFKTRPNSSIVKEIRAVVDYGRGVAVGYRQTGEIKTLFGMVDMPWILSKVLAIQTYPVIKTVNYTFKLCVFHCM